jgi:hypothetical protein
MGSNDVISIRVEALGISITIADGSIAIERTKTGTESGRSQGRPYRWPRRFR